VQKSEDYHDVVLKSLHPFAHVIEPAVCVFALEQNRQWEARQQKNEDEFEKCVQSKREDPSKKQYYAGSNQLASFYEYRGILCGYLLT
jgi:hypothetical protein